MWTFDSRPVRTPTLLDSTVLKIDPLAKWWSFEDVVYVALRSSQHVPVLSVAGVLDERAAQPCRQALGAALRTRPNRIVLDLGAVSEGRDQAVGLLQSMRRSAAWHGARVWLAAVPTGLREVLGQARLSPAFPISRTAARALEEMDRPATVRRSA